VFPIGRQNNGKTKDLSTPALRASAQDDAVEELSDARIFPLRITIEADTQDCACSQAFTLASGM
jgi:hypothetical protein